MTMGNGYLAFVRWEAFLQLMSEQRKCLQTSCRDERRKCLLQNPGIIPRIVCRPQVGELIQKCCKKLQCRIILSAHGKMVNQRSNFISEKPLIRELQPVNRFGDELSCNDRWHLTGSFDAIFVYAHVLRPWNIQDDL